MQREFHTATSLSLHSERCSIFRRLETLIIALKRKCTSNNSSAHQNGITPATSGIRATPQRNTSLF